MTYKAHPRDVRDKGGRLLVRARFIERIRPETWLVYDGAGDTHGAVQRAGKRYLASSCGSPVAYKKDLREAIAVLLPEDEKKEFEGPPE